MAKFQEIEEMTRDDFKQWCIKTVANYHFQPPKSIYSTVDGLLSQFDCPSPSWRERKIEEEKSLKRIFFAVTSKRGFWYIKVKRIKKINDRQSKEK